MLSQFLHFRISLPRLLTRALALLAAGALCQIASAQPAGAAADPLEGFLQEDAEVTPPAPVEIGPVPARERHHYGLKLADTARTQIGTSYQLGRSKPGQGFDCSGLVWWVYRQHGIELPRVSTQQALVGESVPLSEAHPGDIVVFKTGRGPNGFHTGIITDAGHFIHAPSTGKRVQETAIAGYWSAKLHSIRRVRGLKLDKPLPSADEINLSLEDGASSESGDPLFAAVSGASEPLPRLGPVKKPAALKAHVREKSAPQKTAAKKAGKTASRHAARSGGKSSAPKARQPKAAHASHDSHAVKAAPAKKSSKSRKTKG